MVAEVSTGSAQLKRRHGREQQDVAASAGQEDRKALVQSEAVTLYHLIGSIHREFPSNYYT